MARVLMRQPDDPGTDPRVASPRLATTVAAAVLGAAIILALAMLFLAAWPLQVKAAECLTTEWWDAVAETNDFTRVGAYGRGFIGALKSVSHGDPMLAEIAAAATVAAWVGPSGDEVMLRFFDEMGCDVGRWSSITPAQLHGIIKLMGTPI